MNYVYRYCKVFNPFKDYQTKPREIKPLTNYRSHAYETEFSSSRVSSGQYLNECFET